LHAQFLGEGVAAMSPPYPTGTFIDILEALMLVLNNGRKILLTLDVQVFSPSTSCRDRKCLIFLESNLPALFERS
jgi:hypothetical protein